MTTIKVPDKYGYVILSCVVVPLFSFFYMGGSVMKARKEFNVQYPNLYATPGYHKQADEFNRVQRGHQNMLESWTTFTAASLLGGLMHPIAVSIFGMLYSAGNILFLAGYSDAKLDVATARYKKGGKYIIPSLGVLFISNVYFSCKLSCLWPARIGVIKHIGTLGAVGACISLAGSMNGWW